jgi:hypothetical protein
MPEMLEDELIDEASTDLEKEIIQTLNEVQEELPEVDSFWEVEDGGNVIGVLNSARSGVGDTEKVVSLLKEAKKTYVLGKRAGVFDDNSELGEMIDSRVELVESLDMVEGLFDELIPELPQIKEDVENSYDELENIETLIDEGDSNDEEDTGTSGDVRDNTKDENEDEDEIVSEEEESRDGEDASTDSSGVEDGDEVVDDDSDSEESNDGSDEEFEAEDSWGG